MSTYVSLLKADFLILAPCTVRAVLRVVLKSRFCIKRCQNTNVSKVPKIGHHHAMQARPLDSAAAQDKDMRPAMPF
jgi:hypothetical protein